MHQIIPPQVLDVPGHLSKILQPTALAPRQSELDEVSKAIAAAGAFTELFVSEPALAILEQKVPNFKRDKWQEVVAFLTLDDQQRKTHLESLEGFSLWDNLQLAQPVQVNPRQWTRGYQSTGASAYESFQRHFLFDNLANKAQSNANLIVEVESDFWTVVTDFINFLSPTPFQGPLEHLRVKNLALLQALRLEYYLAKQLLGLGNFNLEPGDKSTFSLQNYAELAHLLQVASELPHETETGKTAERHFSQFDSCIFVRYSDLEARPDIAEVLIKVYERGSFTKGLFETLLDDGVVKQDSDIIQDLVFLSGQEVNLEKRLVVLKNPGDYDEHIDYLLLKLKPQAAIQDSSQELGGWLRNYAKQVHVHYAASLAKLNWSSFAHDQTNQTNSISQANNSALALTLAKLEANSGKASAQEKTKLLQEQEVAAYAEDLDAIVQLEKPESAQDRAEFRFGRWWAQPTTAVSAPVLSASVLSTPALNAQDDLSASNQAEPNQPQTNQLAGYKAQPYQATATRNPDATAALTLSLDNQLRHWHMVNLASQAANVDFYRTYNLAYVLTGLDCVSALAETSAEEDKSVVLECGQLPVKERLKLYAEKLISDSNLDYWQQVSPLSVAEVESKLKKLVLKIEDGLEVVTLAHNEVPALGESFVQAVGFNLDLANSSSQVQKAKVQNATAHSLYALQANSDQVPSGCKTQQVYRQVDQQSESKQTEASRKQAQPTSEESAAANQALNQVPNQSADQTNSESTLVSDVLAEALERFVAEPTSEQLQQAHQAQRQNLPKQVYAAEAQEFVNGQSELLREYSGKLEQFQLEQAALEASRYAQLEQGNLGYPVGGKLSQAAQGQSVDAHAQSSGTQVDQVLLAQATAEQYYALKAYANAYPEVSRFISATHSLRQRLVYAQDYLESAHMQQVLAQAQAAANGFVAEVNHISQVLGADQAVANLLKLVLTATPGTLLPVTATEPACLSNLVAEFNRAFLPVYLYHRLQGAESMEAVWFNYSRFKNSVSGFVDFVRSKLGQAEQCQAFQNSLLKLQALYAQQAEQVEQASEPAQELNQFYQLVNGWAWEYTQAKTTYRHVQPTHELMAYRNQESQVQTSGSRIGQVNALAVVSTSGYEPKFGEVFRISAVVNAGHGAGNDFDSAANFTDGHASRSRMIVNSYLKSLFKEELHYGVNITNEQVDRVAGDSAGLASAIATFSALAKLPVWQHFAVTGAVDQFGNVLPVGGLVEKISAFYDLCKTSPEGLIGIHGVIVPAVNFEQLVLPLRVVEAIKAGTFKVYTVEHIADALEILTNVAFVSGADLLTENKLDLSFIHQRQPHYFPTWFYYQSSESILGRIAEYSFADEDDKEDKSAKDLHKPQQAQALYANPVGAMVLVFVLVSLVVLLRFLS